MRFLLTCEENIFPKHCSHFSITVCPFVSTSITDMKVLAKPLFYLMVQLKFVPNSAEDYVPHHKVLPVRGFHSQVKPLPCTVKGNAFLTL